MIVSFKRCCSYYGSFQRTSGQKRRKNRELTVISDGARLEQQGAVGALKGRNFSEGELRKELGSFVILARLELGELDLEAVIRGSDQGLGDTRIVGVCVDFLMWEWE